MVLALIIAVALVGIVLVAFRGVFGEFPAEWEWVAFFLGGIGLAMATPPILQRAWGRPVLLADFDRGVEGPDRFLPVYLRNPPVRKRVLRWLGVRRETIQSLTVQFRISEAGSNKTLVPIRQARIYSDDDPTDTGHNRLSLPPTYSPSNVEDVRMCNFAQGLVVAPVVHWRAS